MPYLDNASSVDFLNWLIFDQFNFDKQSLASEASSLIAHMTNEQKSVFNKILLSPYNPEGNLFFVYGFDGPGKTFIWNALTLTLRSRGEIVLTVSSRGITFILLLAGTTTHSWFAIPIAIAENSTCNISQGSSMVELIRRTKLIIWDEALMVNKLCYKAIDQSFRDILQLENANSVNLPFGGKCTMLGGNFRQILPVVPRGNRSDIVFTSINSSYLWDHCEVLTLS